MLAGGIRAMWYVFKEIVCAYNTNRIVSKWKAVPKVGTNVTIDDVN